MGDIVFIFSYKLVTVTAMSFYIGGILFVLVTVVALPMNRYLPNLRLQGDISTMLVSSGLVHI